MDGLSYIRAHVFTANMTGNFVLLALHLAQHDLADAGRSFLSLISYAAGCLLAAFVILKREKQGQPAMLIGLSTECLLLLIFAALSIWDQTVQSAWVRGAFICVGAVSLATQAVTVRGLHVAGVSTTYITGTITLGMVGVMDAALEQREPARVEEARHVALLIGLLTVYFTGAVISAILSRYASIIPSVAPVCVVSVVIWRLRRNSP